MIPATPMLFVCAIVMIVFICIVIIAQDKTPTRYPMSPEDHDKFEIIPLNDDQSLIIEPRYVKKPITSNIRS
jgi:hypothetical protein